MLGVSLSAPRHPAKTGNAERQLAIIEEADGTLSLRVPPETPFTLTITQPEYCAGEYQIDPADIPPGGTLKIWDGNSEYDPIYLVETT